MTHCATSTTRRHRVASRPSLGDIVAVVVYGLAVACASSGRPEEPGVAPSAASREQALSPAFIEARRLERAGDLAAARQAYRRIRVAEPGAWSAWIGEIEATDVDPTALRVELDDCSRTSRSESDRSSFLALSALVDEDAARSSQSIDDLKRRAPANAVVWTAAGLLHSRRGEQRPALDCLDRAVRCVDPPHAAWRHLALTALAEGDRVRARWAIEACEALFPQDVRWPYNLGTLLLRDDGDVRAARAAFERARELQPDDPDVIFNLATALDRDGRPEEAARALNRVIELRPHSPDAVFNLAVIEADRFDRPGRALELFRQYLRMVGTSNLRVERWIKELEERIDS